MMYEAKGRYREKGSFKLFTRQVEAESSKLAGEKIKCLFGSEHKLKRRQIIIEEVKKAEVS
jgi:ribosomal protein L20A (L18A)